MDKPNLIMIVQWLFIVFCFIAMWVMEPWIVIGWIVYFGWFIGLGYYERTNSRGAK